MARKSDGIRLHVRTADGSRSATRNPSGTKVPTEFGNVGNVPTADEVDRLFSWATDAVLGDVAEETAGDALERGAA